MYQKWDDMQVKGSLDGLPIMLAGNKSEEGGAKREVAYRTGEALQVKIFTPPYIFCRRCGIAST